ncbi:hypothetical protein BCR32DRAFT_307871 [Anaeromyces robustus]|nr:hypothetical protein BCR32DRAFT_307871 [Anaeromyces robustus]|eukprot:ORX63279.1 hypothetical protein BCR32DRAFT_307871 [Anaeromyces robustus]
MYEASLTTDPNEEMRKVYFEIILHVLKLSAEEKQYQSLFEYAVKSINIDYNNLEFDRSKIEDETYKEVADKLYFSDLLNHYNKTYFNRNKFYDKNESNYNSFYNEINEKYFENRVKSEDIGYLIKYFNKYNLEVFLSQSSINGTFVSEFVNNFLIDYDDSLSVEDMVDSMNEEIKSEHNIFDMIYNLCDVLNRDTNFKYIYNVNNKDLNILDIDSFYENANSLAEVIYNLIYDYYNYIYNISLDNDESNYFTPLYHFDGDNISFTFRYGNTLEALEDSDFYDTIYNTIIVIAKNNPKSIYISKCLSLVEELYKVVISDYPLKEIKKEKFTDKIEIDYKSDITDAVDITLTKNTFKYLIDNENKNIYLNELKSYIEEVCNSYDKESSSNSLHEQTAMELEYYFNSVYIDNILVLSDKCTENYEDTVDNWLNNISESIDENSFYDYMILSITKAMDDAAIYGVIEAYLDDYYNNNNNTLGLTKRALEKEDKERILYTFNINLYKNENSEYRNQYEKYLDNFNSKANEEINNLKETALQNSRRENLILNGIEKGLVLSSTTLSVFMGFYKSIMETKDKSYADHSIAADANIAIAANAGSMLMGRLTKSSYKYTKKYFKKKHFSVFFKNKEQYKDLNNYIKLNQLNKAPEIEFANIIRNLNEGENEENKFILKTPISTGEPNTNSDNGNDFYLELDFTDNKKDMYLNKLEYKYYIREIYLNSVLKGDSGMSEEEFFKKVALAYNNELSNAKNFGKLKKQIRESVENDAKKNIEAKMKEEIKTNIMEKNNGESIDENELENRVNEEFNSEEKQKEYETRKNDEIDNLADEKFRNLKFDLDKLLTPVNVVDGYLELLKFIETKYNESNDDEYKKKLSNALALTFENLNSLKFSGKAFSITKLTEDQRNDLSKIEFYLNEEIQMDSASGKRLSKFENIVNTSSKYSKKLEKCFKKLKNRFSSEMVNIYEEAKKREKENPGSSSGGSSGGSSGDKTSCTSILKKTKGCKGKN